MAMTALHMIPSCRMDLPTVWRAGTGQIYDLSHTVSAACRVLITTGAGGQTRGVTDDDAGPIARDDPGLLELREGARDELSNGAEPCRELGVGQGELHAGARLDGRGYGRVKVAGQAFDHWAEGEVADDACKVADSARHRLQHGKRDLRPSLTQTENVGAGRGADVPARPEVFSARRTALGFCHPLLWGRGSSHDTDLPARGAALQAEPPPLEPIPQRETADIGGAHVPQGGAGGEGHDVPVGL